jgi:hypothetical protein
MNSSYLVLLSINGAAFRVHGRCYSIYAITTRLSVCGENITMRTIQMTLDLLFIYDSKMTLTTCFIIDIILR